MERLYLHRFMDGRDTSPTHGGELSATWRSSWMPRAWAHRHVSGRYYGMDRDKRWERVKLAYDALVHGEGPHRPTVAGRRCGRSYAEGVTDEFVLPTVVDHEPEARIATGHRHLLQLPARPHARADPGLHRADFAGLRSGGPRPPRVIFVGMTEYDATFGIPVAFPKDEPRTCWPRS